MTFRELINRAYCRALVFLLRPYIRRELPGWGLLYRAFIGSYRANARWQGFSRKRVRGKLHGYEMLLDISGWSNRQTFFLERFYDLQTQLLLKAVLRPGDCVIDVGANEGMITLLAASLVGETGRVIAFEPNPLPRKILQENLEINAIRTVEVVPAGLGDGEGQFRLFVPAINSGEGSFTTPKDSSAGSYVECPIYVGDRLLLDRRPRLIKIDVEGYERHVLQGLSETLKRARPLIVIEVVDEHLRRDGFSARELCALFNMHGYFGYRLELKRRAGRYELVAFKVESCAPGGMKDGDYVWFPGSKSASPMPQMLVAADLTELI